MNLNERFTPRTRLLLFQTLELLRKEVLPRFEDQKSADDWLFSQLDFTKDELAQIYKGRDVLYYDGSAVDLDEAKLEGKRLENIERLIGRPLFSSEANVVIEDLKLMLGVDALELDTMFETDSERRDMARYIERVIQEYHLENAEKQFKDGCHGYMNASIPLSSIRLVDSEPSPNKFDLEQLRQALQDKVAAEITKFRKAYDNVELEVFHQDWYKLRFYEEFASMLTDERLEFSEELQRLAFVDKPLEFLYNKHILSGEELRLTPSHMKAFLKLVHSELIPGGSETLEGKVREPKPLDDTIAIAAAEAKDKERSSIEYVEYVGSVYEVYDIGQEWATLMDGHGELLKLSKAEFDTLRKLEETDISRYDKNGRLLEL